MANEVTTGTECLENYPPISEFLGPSTLVRTLLLSISAFHQPELPLLTNSVQAASEQLLTSASPTLSALISHPTHGPSWISHLRDVRLCRKTLRLSLIRISFFFGIIYLYLTCGTPSGGSEKSALGTGPSSWGGKVTVTAPPSLSQ